LHLTFYQLVRETVDNEVWVLDGNEDLDDAVQGPDDNKVWVEE
jgi:hypothetical protein